MNMTIQQVNALIALIGNTRQVPHVTDVYMAQTRIGDELRCSVEWFKRRGEYRIKQGVSTYRWIEAEGKWLSI